MREDRTSLFWMAGEQAVLLPKGYRFRGTEVHIRRRGDSVILEPLPTDWRWLDERISTRPDADFIEALEERPEIQHRPCLERLSRLILGEEGGSLGNPTARRALSDCLTFSTSKVRQFLWRGRPD